MEGRSMANPEPTLKHKVLYCPLPSKTGSDEGLQPRDACAFGLLKGFRMGYPCARSPAISELSGHNFQP